MARSGRRASRSPRASPLARARKERRSKDRSVSRSRSRSSSRSSSSSSSSSSRSPMARRGGRIARDRRQSRQRSHSQSPRMKERASTGRRSRSRSRRRSRSRSTSVSSRSPSPRRSNGRRFRDSGRSRWNERRGRSRSRSRSRSARAGTRSESRSRRGRRAHERYRKERSASRESRHRRSRPRRGSRSSSSSSDSAARPPSRSARPEKRSGRHSTSRRSRSSTRSPDKRREEEKASNGAEADDEREPRAAEEKPRRSVSKEAMTPPRTSRASVDKADVATPPRSQHKTETEQTPPRASPTLDKTPPRATEARHEANGHRKKRTRRSVSSSSGSSSSSASDSSAQSRARPRKRRSKALKAASGSPRQSKKRSGQKEPKPRPERLQENAKLSADAEQPQGKERVRTSILTADGKTGRTGGVYIPPFKLAQMRREIKDKNSEAYQRTTWDALRKSINGLINKVNVSNIGNIIPELFQENLVRGRGLLARSIMKAQLASPGFTHIYAALVAVLNTKMPENGELLIKRVIYRFRRSYKRGDKVVAIALVRFIAHLVNQQVVHELLALQVLELLLANPTDDSVEVAVNFTKECGQILTELCPEGLRAVFETFRSILHEGDIDKRVQYTIEGLFAIRKGGFADYPAVHEQLDLVESSDQITHELSLDDEIDCEDQLDVFRLDPEYEKNEHMWSAIKKEILGESESDSSDSGDDGDASSSDSDDEEQAQAQDQGHDANANPIQDYTEQDLVNLRRTIYLTIMSSISHEECAHKLMKLNIRPGQEKEICSMLIECCSQERTYLRYYGLLGQRFCLLKREYQDAFDVCFSEQYALIHRLETNKLRNVAKFFAHLLFTDSLPWTVFEYIRLNEEDTTSSSRIFIKILCQELSEHLGLKKLKERFNDEFMRPIFSGLFPRDNPRHTRFAINFFTSIGLGGLTLELREFLKNAPQLIMAQRKANAAADSSASDSSDNDDDDSSSSSGSSSGSESSSSGSDSGSDSGSSSDSSTDSDSDSD